MPLLLPVTQPLPLVADLVIIGGGIVGAATAFAAAKAGLRPLIIERRPLLGSLTTAAATGGFRLQHEDYDDWQLTRDSLSTILHFAEVTSQRTYDPAVVQRGYLWLTTDNDRIAEQRALVAQQHHWGQTDVELLTGATVRDRFPYISERVVGGRFRAGDGTFDQKALTFGLATASQAPLITNCTVNGVLTRGGKVTGVTTSKGIVQTTTVVLAAGPFSGPLAATLGLTLPLQNIRRQKVIIPDLSAVPPTAPMTLDEDTGTHWRPAFRGALLLGATPPPIVEEATEQVAPDPPLAFSLLDPRSPIAAARIAPFWATAWANGAFHWSLQAGHYTVTPDNKPLIGPTSIAGCWLNCGYGGHGVMMSIAGSQRLIAQIQAGQPAPDNPFDPARTFRGGSKIL